jgi:pimeloyl-ACP methyl ester carboxylesterase
MFWDQSPRRWLRRPDRVRRLVLIDAAIPGIGPWEEILKNPLLWHFRFDGPDMGRLVPGRERIYLDRLPAWRATNPARLWHAAAPRVGGATSRDRRRTTPSPTCPRSRRALRAPA